MNDKEPLLEEVLDYGQGYDYTIVKLFQAFKKFRDGYYELINYGDDWWDHFNQNISFDREMEKAWKSIDGNHQIMDATDVMGALMIGTYCRFNKFVDGVNKCYEQGGGFRHEEDEHEDGKV